MMEYLPHPSPWCVCVCAWWRDLTSGTLRWSPLQTQSNQLQSTSEAPTSPAADNPGSLWHKTDSSGHFCLLTAQQ